jgi:hypothetical protein
MVFKRSDPQSPTPRGAGRDWLLVSLLVFCLTGFFTSSASAQIFTGSVTGVVTDPTGAVVPGAKVTLTDVNKGFAINATTDAVGRYVITSLSPSTYKLTVEAQGFKTNVQDGIALDVNQKVAIDVALQLGAAVQTVEVTGAAPVLSTQDAVMGQELDRTFVNDLPLLGRGVFDLAFLAPGVVQAPGATFGPSNNANNFSSNGGRNAIAEVLIDGVTATTYEPNSAISTVLYTPSVDAVQEFKVQQNNYSAEVGFTGNTYVNMVLRSGTNAFHGSAWDFLRNEKLDSQDFFANRAGQKLPPLRKNTFGFTIGGPIKKDKTFFFFDYEGDRTHSMGTHSAGVPSLAMRQGDFGELCARKGGTYDASGRCSSDDGQLWDPYTGVYVPDYGGPELMNYIPFNNLATYQSPGNPNLDGTGYQLPAVPGNLIDPVALKMMQFYPMPNVNVGTDQYDPYNNWTGSGINTGGSDQFDIRIDHRFNDQTSIYGRFSRGRSSGHGMNCFGTALDPCTQGPGSGRTHSGVLALNHTFSPTTLLNVTYGVTRNFWYTQGVAKDFPDFDPIGDLGLPDYLRTAGTVASPVIYVYGGYRQASGEAIGAQAWSVYRNGSEAHHLLATLTHMQGRHELKFGGEFRVNRMNWYQVGVPGGVFIYDFNVTSEYPWWGGGDAMASFLTGVGGPSTWGQYEIAPYMSTQNYRYGGFIQDNWRMTDKLTVTLGLRYDLEIPRTERYNRMSWLDPEISLPISVPPVDAASWPSILPVPDLSNLHGGLVFADASQRHPVDTDWNNFGPRLNLAYRLTPKTVLRAGYGLFYNPTEFGTTGAGPGGTDGFSGSTNWNTTYQSDGVTPWGRLSDPFPGGVSIPTGSSLGVLTRLGTGVTAPLRNANATPYTQTWSFGFQRELPASILLDVNYIGTKGTKLYFHSANGMNYFGSWIESASQDTITALNTRVPNPFYGVITDPASGLSGETIGAATLLTPYPQSGGFAQFFPPWANSIYHAFQLKVEKRMSKGLQFLATYTNSKSIDDASISTYTEWLGGFGMNPNPNNRHLTRSLSEWDLSQVLQFAYVYELPWGRGRKWGTSWNAWLSGIVGGWKTNGIWRFDTGQPVALGLSGGQSPITYGGQQPNLLAPLRVNDRSKWFTDGYFANPEVAVLPPPYTVGSAPRMLPNTRLPGTATTSLSLFKEVPLSKLREGARIEFRAEAFNAFNHPQFGDINRTVNTGNFGSVQSQVNVPREIQLALKLYW